MENDAAPPSRDRSELALFEDRDGRTVCRLLRRYDQVPFSEQEADLRRLLEHLPVARLSIDKSGIGMNLAENLARNCPQVVPEAFTNDSKERWATDLNSSSAKTSRCPATASWSVRSTPSSAGF